MNTFTEEDVERLYKEFEPLIKYLARKFGDEDLFSAGVEGLLGALKSFDHTKGVKFRTYAEHRIKGAMLDELRAESPYARSDVEIFNSIKEAIEELEYFNSDDCSSPESIYDKIVEIRERKNKEKGTEIKPPSKEKVQSLLYATIKGGTVSLYNEDGDEFLNPEVIKKTSSVTPEQVFLFKEEAEVFEKEFFLLLEKTGKKFNNQERIGIFLMYWLGGMSMKEVSVLYEMTESRVSQICSENLRLGWDGKKDSKWLEMNLGIQLDILHTYSEQSFLVQLKKVIDQLLIFLKEFDDKEPARRIVKEKIKSFYNTIRDVIINQDGNVFTESSCVNTEVKVSSRNNINPLQSKKKEVVMNKNFKINIPEGMMVMAINPNTLMFLEDDFPLTCFRHTLLAVLILIII